MKEEPRVSDSRLCLEIPVSSRFLHVAANFVRSASVLYGCDEDAMEAIEIAAMEGVENVIDHARLDSRARIKIFVEFENEQVIVEIRDRGVPWPREVLSGTVGHEMPPAESPRGRGLAMMRALMDQVTTQMSPDGEKILRLMKRRVSVGATG
jgi:serine/threonine-protein kinase RsbW